MRGVHLQSHEHLGHDFCGSGAVACELSAIDSQVAFTLTIQDFAAALKRTLFSGWQHSQTCPRIVWPMIEVRKVVLHNLSQIADLVSTRADTFWICVKQLLGCSNHGATLEWEHKHRAAILLRFEIKTALA